jgi:hypothetical protein
MFCTPFADYMCTTTGLVFPAEMYIIRDPYEVPYPPLAGYILVHSDWRSRRGSGE